MSVQANTLSSRLSPQPFWLKAILWSVLSLGAVSVSGCSTIGGVGDAISSLNPFDNDDDDGQGEVADGDQRISILALDETLVVTGSITPADVVLPQAYTNTDWSQVGGNTEHVLQHTSASGPLDRIWSKNAGKGSFRKGRVVAQPVLADGRIVVMDGSNRVSAFDADTGRKLWDYKVRVLSKGRARRGRASIIERFQDPLSLTDRGGLDKESVGGGVAIADGKVYVTSGLGLITALDAASGKAIWRNETRTPIHSAPTVSGGRLYAISDDNELFALNSNTGAVIWTYQGIVESARMLTAPSPAVVGDAVIAPFASGEVVALRAQNGGVLWQDALSSTGRLTPLSSLNDIASGPVVADGYVIATAQSGVMSAFDLRTGQRIWTQPAGSLGFPWVAGDFVYTVTTDGEVICVSKIDGTVIWITQLPAYKNQKKKKNRIAWSGPVMAGERLFLVSSHGRSVEVNPYNGAIIREGKVGGSVFISPIIANETVYVFTDNAKLVALR